MVYSGFRQTSCGCRWKHDCRCQGVDGRLLHGTRLHQLITIDFFMLVFSTCWNSHRHQDGEEMIDEILSLGFDHVELSHGIKLSLLPGIMRAVKAGKV